MGVWEQVEGKGHSKEMRAGEAARLKAEQCGAVRCSAVQRLLTHTTACTGHLFARPCLR